MMDDKLKAKAKLYDKIGVPFSGALLFDGYGVPFPSGADYKNHLPRLMEGLKDE